MRVSLRCEHLNKGIRIIISIVLGIALVTGAWYVDAHAASANAPVPKTVTYKGNGKVKIVFREKVKFRKPKIRVTDKAGVSYKAKILSKGRDSLTFYVKKCSSNRNFNFVIRGIKVRGFKKYTKVEGQFYSSAPNKVVIESADYDAKSGQVEFEFKDKVEWKSPSVKITRKSRRYDVKVIDKDSEDIEVKVRPLKYGKTYKYKITGVRSKGADEYVTVQGQFRAVTQ